jgi:cytochrome c oxidase subunit II
MPDQFQLFPDQASSFAPQVDALFFYILGVSVFFSVLIAGCILYFAVKYRRRAEGEPVAATRDSTALEVTWSVIPLGLVLVMFVWGSRLYYSAGRPPADAMEIHVVGKQWMWKVQHPEGRREINELHVPLGRDIKLTMISEDVIHDFFVPAFRVKRDVLPGRYTAEWFKPTKLGAYHLFCAQYCGTLHSRMAGTVFVMDPRQYESWLSGTPADEPPAVAGEKLFLRLGCPTCHSSRAPTLAGLYAKPVHLTTGQTQPADDDYIRESILEPGAKIVAGYLNLMPTYKGQLSEEQVIELIAYIKSLKPPAQE